MKKICPVCKAEYLGGESFCPVDAARLVTPSQLGSEENSDPLIGTTFDRYQIIRGIGAGGMGLVYEARHTTIDKRVAVKVLRDNFSSRPEVVERFKQEAKSASRIGHENIVDISDFGTTPSGRSYFVMEYLEGKDLADVLVKEPTLDEARLAEIGIQCARALGAAHEKGIIHRDMKPENVFLVQRDGKEFVKVVDFGIAKMSDIETGNDGSQRKLTKTGMIFGTPEYMSPEQAAGKPIDHRADIYAVGVILYEAAVGKVPFTGDAFMAVLTAHMIEDVPDMLDIAGDSYSAAFCNMVMKCLEKSPNDRFQNMAELEAALTTLRDGGDVSSFMHAPSLKFDPIENTGTFKRATDQGSKTSGKLGAGLLGLAILGGAAAFSFWPQQESGEEEITLVGSDSEATGSVDGEMESAETELENSTDDPPSYAQVFVSTVPTGAEVVVLGHDDLGCEETPCSFSAQLGERLSLRAHLGDLAGSAQLNVTAESSVTISLEGSARPTRMTPARVRSGSTSGTQAGTEDNESTMRAETSVAANGETPEPTTATGSEMAEAVTGESDTSQVDSQDSNSDGSTSTMQLQDPNDLLPVE